MQLKKSLCVAICTRHRPAELAECLRSIRSSSLVDQVVVSSDGRDQATDEVCRTASGSFRDFRYVYGPQKGLAANRNNCVDTSDTTFIMFLDDDARLVPAFVEVALAAATEQKIVTGWENMNGTIRTPCEPDFLGFQRISPGIRQKAIVINSSIFPRDFLRSRPFDEFYEFGSEEIDICYGAVARGLVIEQVDAGNDHRHVDQSRAGNEIRIVRSKMYFGVRRYTCYEPSRLRLVAFVAYGVLNRVGHDMRTGGVKVAWRTLREVRTSITAGWQARGAGAGAPPRRYVLQAATDDE